MKASERLQLRRDELAFGGVKWVNRSPNRKGEACLVMGGEHSLSGLGTSFDRTAPLRRRALGFLRKALRARGSHQELTRWNDRRNRRLVDVLGLYDDAIILAKEAGD